MKIYSIANQTFEKIKFELSEIKTPFGIEQYANMKYINWEMNDNMVELLELVDNSFKNEINKLYSKYNTWTWKSAIKKSDSYNTLLRTKLNVDNAELNVLNNIIIIIDSIWLDNKSKTYGILWLTSIIN